MDDRAYADARAELLALAADAAPHPVPADQAIALLQETGSADPEALGRLAYHALTGVDPGPAGQEAPRPSEVIHGFPAFAAEVLARAVNGPDERRPTAAALLMVLQTTPEGAWPTRAGTAEEPADSEEPVAPEEEPVAEAPEEEAEVEVEPEMEPDPAPADASVRRTQADSPNLHDDFRRVVAPVHAVPRFDPLEGAGELPVATHDLERRSRPGRERRRVPVTRDEDHRQTLVMVGVILLLALVGVIYALGQGGGDDTQGEPAPPAQGASRTQVQPSSADLS